MVAWFSHAPGIIISAACQIGRPARCSSSRHSSKLAVSDAPGVMIGKARSSPRDQRGRHQRLAGAHPVAVALHGVDLAVVGQVAVRVRERPRRERVGGEAAVHQRQRGLDPLVGEVGEELGELGRGEHALVDEGAARQRREVDHLVAGARTVELRELVLAALAHHEEQAVELDAGGAAGVGDEELAEARAPRSAPSGRSSTCRPAPRATRPPGGPRPRRWRRCGPWSSPPPPSSSGRKARPTP